MGLGKTAIWGIILMAIGIFAIVNKGIYISNKDNVAQVGNLSVDVQKKSRDYAPIIGGVLIVCGLFLLVSGKKK